MVLAVIAVLAVAGPGMVYATSATPSYAKPVSGVIIGDTAVTHGTSGHIYMMTVTFDNGTTSNVTSSATFTAVLGSFTGNSYSAPSATGRDRVTGTYTSGGQSVVANKIIFVQ